MCQKKNIVFDAISLAVKAHDGQFRKGTNIPYIFHPMAVGKILFDIGCDEDVVVGGLLHDILEDTSISLDEIHLKYGEKIAHLVDGASYSETGTWMERRKNKLAYLENAPEEVILIECADKLDNIRAISRDFTDLGDELWSRFSGTKEQLKWHYTALSELFIDRGKGNVKIANIAKEIKIIVNSVFIENEI